MQKKIKDLTVRVKRDLKDLILPEEHASYNIPLKCKSHCLSQNNATNGPVNR